MPAEPIVSPNSAIAPTPLAANLATATATGTIAKPKPTLGLTGLTINAMALIAPGAFLWLTYQQQSLYGAPMAGGPCGSASSPPCCSAWRPPYSYAELSKMYPGAGSSYFFAEQAFLAKTTRSSSPASPSSSPAGPATSTTGFIRD